MPLAEKAWKGSEGGGARALYRTESLGVSNRDPVRPTRDTGAPVALHPVREGRSPGTMGRQAGSAVCAGRCRMPVVPRKCVLLAQALLLDQSAAWVRSTPKAHFDPVAGGLEKLVFGRIIGECLRIKQPELNPAQERGANVLGWNTSVSLPGASRGWVKQTLQAWVGSRAPDFRMTASPLREAFCVLARSRWWPEGGGRWVLRSVVESLFRGMLLPGREPPGLPLTDTSCLQYNCRTEYMRLIHTE